MAGRRSIQFSPPLYEAQMSRVARRAKGVYYTPPEIVRLIVDWTLSPLLDGRPNDDTPLRILDPACGAGEFLAQAHRRVAERRGCEQASQSIFGMDIDATAVAACHARLPGLNSRNIRVGDALARDALESGSFTAIVGNPPYVNIRELTKTHSAEQLDDWRGRFLTARGSFDLYVLFIERALELLKSGGRCGLIVPNKWATLDYARPCRELLAGQATIERVVDCSDMRIFAGASVYPNVIVFRKECATAGRRVTAQGFDSGSLDVEARVATLPLAEVAKLSCGTAGFSAQRIAARLQEADESRNPAEGVHDSADFITSGNIDRYAIHCGQVRYMNRTYLRPRLTLDIPELTEGKRRLFRSPKIVVAGMSRRLEAAWDASGLALGVQVFAVSEIQVDPFFLLGLLNSKLLSFLFMTRFAGKKLSGGYLAINKGQLCQLPIVSGTAATSPAGKRLAEIARQLGQAGDPAGEEEADSLVFGLYSLTREEIARVEACFRQSAEAVHARIAAPNRRPRPGRFLPAGTSR